MAIGMNFSINSSGADDILKALSSEKNQALEMIGLLAEGYAKQELENEPRRVDTGRLRNSITHQVEGDKAVHIGSNVEYAPLAI